MKRLADHATLLAGECDLCTFRISGTQQSWEWSRGHTVHTRCLGPCARCERQVVPGEDWWIITGRLVHYGCGLQQAWENVKGRVEEAMS